MKALNEDLAIHNSSMSYRCEVCHGMRFMDQRQQPPIDILVYDGND